MTEPSRRRKPHSSRPFTLVVAIAVLALVLPGISAGARLQRAKPALPPAMAADTVGVCSDGSTPSMPAASAVSAPTGVTLPDFQAIVTPSDPGVRTITYDGVKLKIKPSA